MTDLATRPTSPRTLHHHPVARATARWIWLAVALGVLLYMMWPSFQIRFGIVDDHEIIDMIGRRDRIPAGDVVDTFLHRANEGIGRFRPVYWVGRTLEAATAGTNATWWHVDRFVLAAVVVAGIYATAVRFVWPPLAGLLALVPVLGIQSETWSRLGPNEAYAMPLLAVGLALVVRRVHRGDPPAQQWVGYGFLLASALAKENFLPVAVVIIAWSALHHGFRRWSRADWVVLAGAAVVAVLDVLAILHKTRAFGDVYGQSRSPANILSWLEFAFVTTDASSRFLLGLVVGVLLCLLPRRPDRRTVVGIVVACVLVVATQVLFYAGGPKAGRYLYPLAILGIAGWILAGHQLRRYADRRWVPVVGAIGAVVLLVPTVRAEVDAYRAGALMTAYNTEAFQAHLDWLEAQIESTQLDVVVVQPYEASSDIEPTLSLARYLTTQTDVTVMTLPAPQSKDGFSDAQNDLLRDWSEHGHSRLSPYDDPAPGSCVSLFFGKSEPVCGRWLPAG